MKKYIAKIGPLNAEKIACSPHGTATFTEDEEQDTLHIMIEMFDTPANIEHWQHFHGFPDGKDAHVATMDNDLNGDGFIDQKLSQCQAQQWFLSIKIPKKLIFLLIPIPMLMNLVTIYTKLMFL